MNQTPFRVLLLLCLLSCFTLPIGVSANEETASGDGTEASGDTKDEAQKDAGPKTMAELAKNCERMEGLFTLLRDRDSGEVYLVVDKDQLGREFIHFSYTENGIPRLGHFRGQFQEERVFTIERDFGRLRFVTQPVRQYYDPNSPLSRAASANVSPAVLAAPKLVAVDEENGQFAVSADKLFLGEIFQQVKPSANPEDKDKKVFKLGKLSEDKTRFAALRNYPKNTDMVVEYVYEDLAPAKSAKRDEGVTDSRYLTIKMQHSLIEMPANGYRPRRDDTRVGYFMLQFDDMTSTSATPYRDVIARWDLKKKNPKAKLSEPVEPITFWLENTTPREFRKVVRDGVLAWNEAFEQAGFKNAVVVRTQPDDADWDAGDLRYNVIRWTSSPDPPFGGYGPSFVNPRTGQILGADIMLEWIYVTYRVRYSEIFGRGNLPFPDADSFCRAGCPCTLAAGLHDATLFGRTALALQGAPQVEMDRLLDEGLRRLVLHEVGHTLGLTHNFRASYLRGPDDLQNAKLTSRGGLTSSAMEYPAVNFAAPGEKQGQYYDTRPGPYDKWAIEYGYSPALDDEAAEEQRLQKILARSTEPELAYANDADDMRYEGKGIDPRAMIFDISSDPIAWADGRIQLVRQLTPKLLDHYTAKGESYQRLASQYALLTRQQDWAARIASRFIGGVYVDRATVGQPGADRPYRPVSADDQRRAMKLLAQYVFAPDAFVLPPDLLAHLQPQRRGFNHYGANEDVKVHENILQIQRGILDQLLHRDVLQRVSDSRLYGNEYELAEMFADLTAAIFDADAGENVSTVRQNLQLEYVERLTKIAPSAAKTDAKYDYLSQSIALFELRRIRSSLELVAGATINVETRAHREHLKLLIDRALAAVAG